MINKVDGRPVINVDLDNVVYPFVGACARYFRQVGVDIPFDDRPGNEGYFDGQTYKYTQWAVWKDWGIPEGRFMRLWREGIKNGFIYGWGEPIAGSVNTLWKLSDADWHIRFITHRLNHFGVHKEVIENTVGWLARNNIPYRSIAFDGVKAMPAVAGVDDGPGNVQDMLDQGIKAFLFDAPHNQKPKEDLERLRVKNWDELWDRIKRIPR